MLAGQTATYQGSEVCLFPLDYMACTQISAPDSYSHCCGHATDWVGPSNNYPVYAPYSGTVTSVGSQAGGYAINFVSDAEVWTPSGLSYVTSRFLHCNSYPPQTGHVNQGELLYYTGQSGMATGDHVHIDASLIANDNIVSYGYYCSGGNLCYALSESEEPFLIYYLTGDEDIINLRGMEFVDWTGSPIIISGKFKWWMSKPVLRRRRLY